MMSQSQYSLSWEAHVRNVCDGLSSLQQNGELVDMTLAADGHTVKVHQVVLALASPFFKELITSVKCPHPVIFLNKVKHATLSAILEYIYTGEVLVSLEHLNDLVEAAKELHIKGLKDMKVHPTLKETAKEVPMEPPSAAILEDEELCLFQVTLDDEERQQVHGMSNIMQFTTECDYDDEKLCDKDIIQVIPNEQFLHNEEDMQSEHIMQHEQDMATGHDMQSGDMQDTQLNNDLDGQDMHNEQIIQQDQDENDSKIMDDDMMQDDSESNISFDIVKAKVDPSNSALQYTVSNQGSLQIILNRFVYYLKHTNRDKSRQWRCVDYLSHSAKCPAYVITKDDMVIQRIAAHTHPYHDMRILKKLKTGAVFSAIIEAEKEGYRKKSKTEKTEPVIDDDSNVE
ncbi:uncharacterized protein [Epargyreus clarus]|uniref:uncharacterized protein n=1 Tax=Epargyreus clarus TaxID=520877 RepID=UPI003C2FDD54